MTSTPEETRLIETMTRNGNMTEPEARAYLANQRSDASKTTRRDARFAVVACILGLLACAGLFYYQFHIGRFLFGLIALLVAATAFCLGALVRNFRNLNSR